MLRQDPRTAAISVIILTARGLSADKLEGFAIGADDYIVKPFDTPELLARVRGVLRRSKEMRDESPLTGLPGNVRVQEEIESHIAAARTSSRCCSPTSTASRRSTTTTASPRGDELDPGDGARSSRRSSPSSRRTDAFVGHLGGDDFVVVVMPSAAAIVADTIVQRFDQRVAEHYDPEDLERGWIEVLNRRGEPQRYEPITISIGVASTQRRGFAHFAEVAGRRDRDEDLHEGDARVLVVGDRPPRDRDLGARVGERPRLREEVALPVPHAQGPERLELRLRLDPFGDDRHPHLVGERDRAPTPARGGHGPGRCRA